MSAFKNLWRASFLLLINIQPMTEHLLLLGQNKKGQGLYTSKLKKKTYLKSSDKWIINLTWDIAKHVRLCKQLTHLNANLWLRLVR